MTETTLASNAEALRGLCDGNVFLPGDPGYDAARTPWNVAVDQRPAAVAVPGSVEHVIEVVKAAARAGLRVLPQSTGHGAIALGGRLGDVVLLRLAELTGVTIDPVRQTARVVGATLWQEVVEAAAAHGLAALHGSAPDVAVAGYTLGGGLSWYARKHGLACNQVVAAEVVLADGTLVRADADRHPNLFWALRGGGGNFGVVTALELKLLPVSQVYAGMMLWDVARAGLVCRAWAEWTHGLADEATTALRLLSVPPMPEVPEFIRGRQLVVIDGAILTDPEQAAALLAPLRALQPELDTFGPMPAAGLTRLHLDPEGPTPSVGDHLTLTDFDAFAADALVTAAGADSGTTLLAAEVRHLGGALDRPDPAGGALNRLDAGYGVHLVAVAATPELGARGRADAARAAAALRPWSDGRLLPTFTEEPAEAASFFGPTTLARLRAIRAQYDPSGTFLANHPLD
ncbi:MAG: FAD-binding oxidoreductase [Propionicimonas sp.]|uniref:FAD-binding oxidoreductase n=1 Tax=Propionicimonas sp. TaxID=1955623 RepID=UPI002B20D7D0|nr:FAD-binding oxidoreductase [Propionicimonas sp.]MEA4944844.1 FAD-binding oxidoreductase [Propionicimonas sp.]MEA5055244.1 FAD-binding oxidoreductase [Propionicimonas sp.]MEA5117602.1 FAD-binding oxidoreductase [Propionicimonas sp.]